MMRAQQSAMPGRRPDDVRRRLQQARLTARQMQCLSLYYHDGMSQAQIGNHLGIGQRVVSQHLRYGLDKLAAIGLSIRRHSVEAPVGITYMDTETLDGIKPEITRAVW